jgi:alkaline phosphatase D
MDRIERDALRWFARARHAPSRRDVLRAALALAAAAALPGVRAGPPPPRPRFTGYPFTLGIASGYPSPDGVVLWTRLAPAPLAPDGGMGADAVAIAWQVAEDERFARVVRAGVQHAYVELAHSVRVPVDGLAPGRTYFYRFTAGDEVSPVGRTRTAPAAGHDAPLRLGFASCQHFEHGWFAGHRHLLADAPDLVAFLGDYIYEVSWGAPGVRRHAGAVDAVALGDYRVRHAQYKTDPDLARLHASMPWVFAWDDHEVDNDYAGEESEHLDPAFLARRAAGYQAYFEHMPMPAAMLPARGASRIYTHLDWGRNARICLLDDRQYRSPVACPPAGSARAGNVDPSCAALADASRSLLGMAQERWLAARLRESPARWNVIAQQSVVAPLDMLPGAGATTWTDSWDGYPATRERLLATLREGRIRNPLAIGGDIHAALVANTRADPRDAKSPVVLGEICASSLSAQGWPPEHWDAIRAENPHVLLADGAHRGYVVLDFDTKRCRAKVRGLDDATRRDSGVETVAELVMEDGVAGFERA